MMKKLLVCVAFIATFGIIDSFSQACTPDISCLAPNAPNGICPDSAIGIPLGCLGVPYNAVVSFKIPSSSQGATVVDVRIDSVTGLAKGLIYTCAPTDCKFPGGSNGCILISGTPTAVQNKRVIVYAVARAKFGPVSVPPQPQIFDDYFSIINNCTGIIDGLNVSAFDVKQNAPNPFSDKTEIAFSSPQNTDVELKVYNVVGSVVYKNTIKAEKGANTITVNANTLSSGVYIYSLTNGDKTITKRMIVSNK